MKKTLLGFVLLSLLMACEAPEGDLYRVEVGKKYHLRSKIDKAFLDHLDSLLESEKVADTEKEEKKVGLLIDPNAPAIDPSQVGKTGQKSSSEIPRPQVLSREEKSARFLNRLNEWSQDAENSAYYRTVSVREGQKSLRDVLRASYGSWTEDLPQSVIRFSLQALNREVDLENLHEGQMLRVPKL